MQRNSEGVKGLPLNWVECVKIGTDSLPGDGRKTQLFGLQSGISKPRGGFTEWIGHESYSIKDLHEVCLFL